MAIKTILVPLDGSKASLEVLDTALVVANRFGAHIDALHVLQHATDAVPFMSDRLSAKLKETVVAEAEKDARERAAVVRKVFDEFCAKHKVTIVEEPTPGTGATAAWREESGRVGEVLIRRGRLTDVVAIARPRTRASTVRRSPAGENLEAVMLGTGRPVLIVPPGWAARRVENVVFGWNESLEASRALAMAMPWLPQMSNVTIIVSKKREPNAKALLDYLAWHGVEAKISLLDNKGHTVSDAILNVCSEVGAELLVVGGFSHSRARELLFGGVTRHLLAQAEILTLMVH